MGAEGEGKMRRASSLICIFNCNGGCLDTKGGRERDGKEINPSETQRSRPEGSKDSRLGGFGGGTGDKFAWNEVKLFQIMARSTLSSLSPLASPTTSNELSPEW